MNDDDRAEWVNNDERLYRWWLSERCGITTFVREHRAELDGYIRGELERGPAS